MRQSWNPLAVPIANTASGRFHSWVATLAAKSWIISRRRYRNYFLRHAVSHYQVNYDVHRQPSRTTTTTATSTTPTTTTTTPPTHPTQRLAYLHNYITDAFSTDTTLRSPTSTTTPPQPTHRRSPTRQQPLPQPLQRRLLNLHNAPPSFATGAVSGPGPGLAVSPSDDSSAGSQHARLSPLPASPPADG